MEVITQKSGNIKTYCVGRVLEYVGIPQSSYKFTWNARTKKNVWKGILNRNGFCYRSVRSKFKKGRISVAHVKRLASSVLDKTLFIVQVKGHILLINGKGLVKVDTDHREKNDYRPVLGIYELSRKV